MGMRQDQNCPPTFSHTDTLISRRNLNQLGKPDTAGELGGRNGDRGSEFNLTSRPCVLPVLTCLAGGGTIPWVLSLWPISLCLTIPPLRSASEAIRSCACKGFVERGTTPSLSKTWQRSTELLPIIPSPGSRFSLPPILSVQPVRTSTRPGAC